MKFLILLSSAALLTLTGCPSRPDRPSDGGGQLYHPNTQTGVIPDRKTTSSPGTPGVVAHVKGRPITLEQLQRPLIEAHGLQFLINIAQLELARQMVREQGLTVTPEEIAAERRRTVEGLFKSSVDAQLEKFKTREEAEKFQAEEYERLLGQVLTQRHVSLVEFNTGVETAANLRKLAEPQVDEKITLRALEEAFRIKYGEKVSVRHIQVRNLQEMAEVQRRLQAGEEFAKVALELSRDELTREYGGKLRPFTRAEVLWPQTFKDAAFALKEPDDISEPIKTGDDFHLIQLIAKIEPQAVKFEDHREAVRDELRGLMLALRTRQLREDLLRETKNSLKIFDPVLARQYHEGLERVKGVTGHSPDHIRRQIEIDNARREKEDVKSEE